jgi:hypothetical protein
MPLLKVEIHSVRRNTSQLSERLLPMVMVGCLRLVTRSSMLHRSMQPRLHVPIIHT